MIRSTFASFVTAQLGLQASQRALDVTGQNMANVNTLGYTRQRVDLVSVTSGGYTNRYAFRPSNEIGQGVKVAGISQVRDQFLDVRFRREYSKLGEVEAKYAVLDDLSSVFDEISVTGLNNQITDFVSQLQSLSTQTGNSEFDGIVRASAEMLAKLFNQYSKQIETVREQQTYQLEKIDVPRVNTILESIASLNQSIREDQTYGNPSLELKDQRNLLLDELAQYTKIDVNYTPVELAPGIIVEDVNISMVSDTVPTTYTSLVDNINFATLTTGKDADGNSQIFLTDWAATPVTSEITDKVTTGVLKGLLDQLNKSGEFDTPPTDQRGIGFYSNMLDLLAQQVAERFNEANSYLNPNYDPLDPTQGPEFLTDHPLFENFNGGTAGITAANISTAQGWMRNEYGITTTKRELAGDNSGARDNVLYMISLFSTKFDYNTPNGTIFNGTFQEFFSQTGSILALDTEATGKLVGNYNTVVNGVIDLREGVSSVSLDEEGINLLRYQKSYNAAARLMTTLDEALDTIISRMGIVGR